MTLPVTQHGRSRFPDLSALAFQHPADLQALEALKNLPAAAKLMRTLSDMWLEKWHHVSNVGDNLRLGPNQCPRIYGLFQEAADILDMPLPEVYLDSSPQINAFAFGMQRYTVTINSGLLDILEEDELLAVIGHELSHIKCDHMLYKTLAEILGTFGADFLGNFLGLGKLLALPLMAALAAWSRRAELSCDRAGLLVTQDPRAVARALTKLGGLGTSSWKEDINLDAVLAQAADYERLDDSILQKGMMVYLSLSRSHPYPIYRAKEILAWSETEQYKSILAGDYLTYAKAAQAKTPVGQPKCPRCGMSVSASHAFCPGCHHRLQAAVAGCQSCKQPIEPSWRVCPACGTSTASAAPAPSGPPAPVAAVEPIKCRQCSAVLHEGFRFCMECGTPSASA